MTETHMKTRFQNDIPNIIVAHITFLFIRQILCYGQFIHSFTDMAN